MPMQLEPTVMRFRQVVRHDLPPVVAGHFLRCLGARGPGPAPSMPSSWLGSTWAPNGTPADSDFPDERGSVPIRLAEKECSTGGVDMTLLTDRSSTAADEPHEAETESEKNSVLFLVVTLLLATAVWVPLLWPECKLTRPTSMITSTPTLLAALSGMATS